jgi:hypothetical protein
MNLEFIGQNVHFAVNLLASLAFFAVFWLTYDAWQERKKRVEAVKWSGFLLLAIGLLLNGAVVEQAELNHGFLVTTLPILSVILRIIGYGLLIAGQLLDPLQKKPVYASDLESEFTAKPARKKVQAVTPVAAGAGSVAKLVLMPVLPLCIAFQYWRRATVGLERHLRPVAVGFGLMAVFEVLAAANAWHTTTNPLFYDWVAVYGPIWWGAQLALLAAGIIFGKWVWQYLTKRLHSQIFIVLVTATVGIYFVSTAGFSLLLLGNTRSQALNDLSTASKVLNYAVAGRELELKAQAEAAVVRPGITAAAMTSDHIAAIQAAGSFAGNHQLSSLVVTDADGKILFRSDDPGRWGDSISDNSLVQRALIGRDAASVSVTSGVVAPNVALVSALPIRTPEGLIVGSIIASRSISNAFVDGIKSSTGLDSTVYGKDQRSATTLTTADGKHRAVGIKETNNDVLTTVLKQGKDFRGETSYQNRTYLAAYAPLKDADNTTLGMLLVARPASSLLADAGRSIELAFLTTVALLALSIVPVYLIAKKISSGVR